MSLNNQARRLAEQGADMRHKIYGVNQTGGEQMFDCEGVAPLPCYFTPVRDQQQLDEAKMNEPHDGIVRIKKSTGFEPRLGQVIRLIDARNGGGDLIVTLDEFGHTALNPEFVIGCGNQFD